MVFSGSTNGCDDLTKAFAQLPWGVAGGSFFSPGLLLQGVWDARRAIIEVYDRGAGKADAQWKADDSPVTEADVRADEILRQILIDGMGMAAEDVVSEEHAARSALSSVLGSTEDKSLDSRIRAFVDPVDGTREFLKRTGQFVICVGLVSGGFPIFGLIHVPVTGETLVGWSRGPGQPGVVLSLGLVPAALSDRGAGTGDGPLVSGLRHLSFVGAAKPSGPLKILLSGTAEAATGGPGELASMLEEGGIKARIIRMGSALKFCRIADGTADVYLRRAPTRYWDTVAGQALVEAAGGSAWMSVKGGAPLVRRLSYTNSSFLNPSFAVFRPGLSPEIQDGLLKLLFQARAD
jgi:3'-phosphoadenosine 5'-phosphosulfate (PAPS) 3'-phosphatase